MSLFLLPWQTAVVFQDIKAHCHVGYAVSWFRHGTLFPHLTARCGVMTLLLAAWGYLAVPATVEQCTLRFSPSRLNKVWYHGQRIAGIRIVGMHFWNLQELSSIAVPNGPD